MFRVPITQHLNFDREAEASNLAFNSKKVEGMRRLNGLQRLKSPHKLNDFSRGCGSDCVEA